MCVYIPKECVCVCSGGPCAAFATKRSPKDCSHLVSAVAGTFFFFFPFKSTLFLVTLYSQKYYMVTLNSLACTLSLVTF